MLLLLVRLHQARRHKLCGTGHHARLMVVVLVKVGRSHRRMVVERRSARAVGRVLVVWWRTKVGTLLLLLLLLHLLLR